MVHAFLFVSPICIIPIQSVYLSTKSSIASYIPASPSSFQSVGPAPGSLVGVGKKSTTAKLAAGSPENRFELLEGHQPADQMLRRKLRKALEDVQPDEKMPKIKNSNLLFSAPKQNHQTFQCFCAPWKRFRIYLSPLVFLTMHEMWSTEYEHFFVLHLNRSYACHGKESEAKDHRQPRLAFAENSGELPLLLICLLCSGASTGPAVLAAVSMVRVRHFTLLSFTALFEWIKGNVRRLCWVGTKNTLSNCSFPFLIPLHQQYRTKYVCSESNFILLYWNPAENTKRKLHTQVMSCSVPSVRTD